MVSKVNAPGVGGGQTSPKHCAETHTRGRLNAYLRPPSRLAGILLRLVMDVGDRIGRGAGPQLRFHAGDRRRLRRRPTRGLPRAGRPAIMGRMPQTDPGAGHLRCPSDCRMTAHVEAGRRLRPRTENLVGVLPAGHWTPLADQPLPALLLTALASLAGTLLALRGSVAFSLFGQLLGASTMSSCRGRPRPLLVILQREGRAPGEVARPEQSPAECSGVDVLVDAGR